mmetsp:Transcript_21422/g.47498  ORF Transcript_21422/g.47498 Transcript_21422/m.47498 type:complete len:315 (+) Transcript_21422:127-1071(+)
MPRRVRAPIAPLPGGYARATRVARCFVVAALAAALSRSLQLRAWVPGTVDPCSYRQSVRVPLRHKSPVVLHAEGSVAAPPGREAGPSPLAQDGDGPAPGIFEAKANIRLRVAPEVSSEPTGSTVKAGELFEVTEVMPRATPDGLAYLQLGDRGWVFDRGIAGDWVGKPIVERVPEEDQASFRVLLGQPELYAEYQKFMQRPDFEQALAKTLDDATQESQKKIERFEKDSRGPGGAALRQKEDRGAPNEEFMVTVGPRWTQLEDEDGMLPADGGASSKRSLSIREPVGGIEALLHKPRLLGSRVGIRIPSACSAL